MITLWLISVGVVRRYLCFLSEHFKKTYVLVRVDLLQIATRQITTSDWLNHGPIPKTQTVVVMNSTDLEVPLWSFKRESLTKTRVS